MLDEVTEMLWNSMRSAKDFFIFAQERVGKDGKIFTIYKFRSMKIGSEKDATWLAQTNGRDRFGHVNNDPRLTYVGNFLRKWKIDELPQLLNLLKGDINFIGPRPLPLEYHYGLTDEQRRAREMFKPGFVPLHKFADYFSIQTADDLRESDSRYNLQRLDDPLTNLRYLCRAMATLNIAMRSFSNSISYARLHPFYAAILLIK